MSLQGHESAARLIALSMKEEADAHSDSQVAALLFALGHAYDRAADRMERVLRESATGYRGGADGQASGAD
jgi:hypothetical protein